MTNLPKNQGCSGCHACASVCPAGCIEMRPDAEGFYYPHVDEAACISCGRCEKVCQSLNPIVGVKEPAAYAAYCRDEALRAESSSGGIFTLLAEYIIDKGGAVFGAAFDSGLRVAHICIEDKSGLAKLRGSKYLQSTVGDAYVRTKALLDGGRPVLFTGTPCQINGLLHYLGREYEGLYTQDIICHGTPSPELWQKYIKRRSAEGGGLAGECFPSFRRKEEGWKTFSVSFKYLNDTEYVRTLDKDPYMQAFLNNLCLRPSCYDCRSKTLKRSSDITLADFWGIDEVMPEMFDDRGCSLVLVNSEKGQRLFDAVKSAAVVKKADLSRAVKYNSSAYKSVKLPKNRDKFMNEISAENFDELVKKYTKISPPRKAFTLAKRIIKRIIRIFR